MSIFIRIWLSFTLVLLLGGCLLLYQFHQQIKPNMRQVVEETLADNAQLMAALVADDVAAHRIDSPAFAATIQAVMNRPLGGKIWAHSKDRVQQHVYITNAQGKVIYDSTGAALGQDFSRWNDVYRTLRGQYGARSSTDPAHPEAGSTMYVAAPIIHEHALVGVLSLGKPSSAVAPYIQAAQQQLFELAAVYFGLAWLLCGAVAWWLRHNIDSVRRYALALAPNRATPHFALAKELNDLTDAIGTMRQRLEDQAYVEHYVETLTHELKSPLAAIRANAELLQDDLPLPDQQRFARNIEDQSGRLHQLAERLLLLARLEKQPHKPVWQDIHLRPLVLGLLEQRSGLISQKQLSVHIDCPADIHLAGEPFWLEQALANLLDNAIDFSPEHGHISLDARSQAGQLHLSVHNTGAALPDYVLSQAFERYFSRPRPDGRKSTGIGLTLVREVVGLHQGQVRLHNTDTGVAVVCTLPLRPTPFQAA